MNKKDKYYCQIRTVNGLQYREDFELRRQADEFAETVKTAGYTRKVGKVTYHYPVHQIESIHIAPIKK